MEDSQIIDLYLKRDERAIDETATKYGSYCEKIAYNILLDRFESEECVNDTYLKTWNSIPPTLPRIFSAFLAKITRNLALGRYRHKNAEKRSGTEISLDELSECVGKGDISDEIELTELGGMISKFLLTESPTARRLFIRRYFFEESIKEIAKAHGMAAGSVKTSLHRTRMRLKNYLAKEGVFI